ncbi:hypothetical protein HY933_03015 [Candidatus Falkowbacteria bacterium]|nr:hypothetical protein [Candidatus Falkowbacteria bacterium]
MTLKNLVWLIAVILFIIPFFWFSHGQADFGGDSSRLYFYEPVRLLQYLDVLSSNRTVVSPDISELFMVPFLIVLTVLKFLLFNNYSLLLNCFNGFLLAGGFLGVYGILRELIAAPEKSASPSASDRSSRDRSLGGRAAYVAAIFGGLFYIFSGILMYNWQKYINSFHVMAVYPIAIWFFLRYLNSKDKRYLIYLLLWTLVFSWNFSFVAAPLFFSFFPLAFLLLLLYAIITQRLQLFVKGVLIVVLIFFFLQAFHLVQLGLSLVDSSSSISTVIFSSAGKLQRGLSYFEGNAPRVRLIYNLLAYPQYYLYATVGAPPGIFKMITDYGIRYGGVLFIFPLIVVLSLLVKKDRRDQLVSLSLLGVFLLVTFFMTANLFGPYGPDFYARLFYLPGFSMFRSFYGAFATIFVFMYALLFGWSLYYILEHVRRRWLRAVILTFLALVMLHSAVPLLTGQISNTVHDQSNNISLAHKFKPSYEQAVAYLRTAQIKSSVLSLPLLNFNYQIIGGQYGGAYVGIATFPMLAGRSTYSGLAAFDYPGSSVLSQDFIRAMIQARDYRALKRLLPFLNLNILFNDTDDTLYHDFYGWPYSKELKELFPNTAAVSQFIAGLGYQPLLQKDNYQILYQPETWLPLLYTPRRVIHVPSSEAFKQWITTTDDYDPRSLVYNRQLFTSAVADAIPADMVTPTLEFKKISTTQYRVIAHKVRGSFPIVLNEAWKDGWQLIPLPAGYGQCTDLAMDFDQLLAADLTEVKAKCAAGLIHETGKQFVSRELQGTIQNNNLAGGSLMETFGRTPLPDQYHLPANEYANSWWIDLDYWQQNFGGLLRQNTDGSYELEMVIQIRTMKYLYAAVAVSVLTLLALLIWLWILKRKS